MGQLFLTLHVITAVLLISLILIQHGKGAQAGAAYMGGGASKTVFGSQGSGGFLFKVTSILAFSFFAISLILANIAYRESKIDPFAGLEDDERIEQTESTVPANKISEELPE